MFIRLLLLDSWFALPPTLTLFFSAEFPAWQDGPSSISLPLPASTHLLIQSILNLIPLFFLSCLLFFFHSVFFCLLFSISLSLSLCLKDGFWWFSEFSSHESVTSESRHSTKTKLSWLSMLGFNYSKRTCQLTHTHSHTHIHTHTPSQTDAHTHTYT